MCKAQMNSMNAFLISHLHEKQVCKPVKIHHPPPNCQQKNDVKVLDTHINGCYNLSRYALIANAFLDLEGGRCEKRTEQNNHERK